MMSIIIPQNIMAREIHDYKDKGDLIQHIQKQEWKITWISHDMIYGNNHLTTCDD